MKVQSINNNSQSFKALKITPEAKTIIKKQAGGTERIAKYTSELVNKVALEQKKEKPSFMQKLKQAWAILNKLQ